ncbi:MAG TPA: hypothetical protein VN673_04070 [Clostridia bacterium]|nr:hypothetical protein [Clostridia bacterium]
MSDQRIEVATWANEAEQKFDYFICGVTGALFAYLGEHFSPRKFEWGVSALEPLALCFLVGAFFVGLKRLQYCYEVKRQNHVMLDTAHNATVLAKALDEAQTVYGNRGQRLAPELVIAEQQEYQRSCEIAESKMRKAIITASWASRVRNGLLLMGFIALLLSKLLLPYAVIKP